MDTILVIGGLMAAAFVVGALSAYIYTNSKTFDEVLFFPDEKLPCRTFFQELERRQVICRQRNCNFAHASDGLNSFMKILSSLQDAEKKIDLCIYDFTERHLSNLIIRKFREGVQVRVITDAHADRQQAGSNSVSKKSDQIPVLKQAGIPVKMTAASGQFGPLMHNKFVIIDDTQLLMGSFNWTHSAITKNHEAVIRTNNARMVSKFSAKFRDMWRQLGDGQLEIVTS